MSRDGYGVQVEKALCVAALGVGFSGVLGCVDRSPRSPDTHPHATVAWRYEVRSSAGNIDELFIDASFLPFSGLLRVDEDAAPFLRDAVYDSGSRWAPVERNGSTWSVPCSAGCRVRYRYALREAAMTLNEPETAIASGGVVVAPPATWLLRPDPTNGSYRFHVNGDPSWRFATGVRAAADGAADTFEAPTETLEDSSFAAFGPFDVARIDSGTMRVDLAIASRALSLPAADVTTWVKTAVDALAAYYGRPFVDRVLVIVLGGKPGSPTRGETLGAGGPAILVRAADGLTVAATRDDWVVTHELVHVSLPSLGREHAWLSEGIATYVEPIVRARAGLVSVETFWHDLVQGLPQGLPEAGDQGLERTQAWGRTYWGGALFCFAADVAIRSQSSNARSFDDALRGIVASGVDVQSHFTIEQFLDMADRAAFTRTFTDLYRSMGLAPGTIDLPQMWQQLGVRLEGQHVMFDEHAPLAAVRRAMTESRPNR